MKKRILFLYRTPTAFIMRDLEILKKRYEVVSLHIKSVTDSVAKVLKNLKNIDLVYIWFAGWHGLFATILSKIFNKKIIVATGGYDVTALPEINYGAFLSWRGIISKYILKNADIVLPFSKNAENEIKKRVKIKKIETVYFGFDYKKYKPKGKKKNIVITVGTVKKSNLKRKGLETFAKTTKLLPNIKFILIGKHNDESVDYLRSISGNNLNLPGFVPEKKLIEYMQKSKVYVQVSAHEGFGCSMAEAMLCECIPVVTKKFAIPEVVGNTGYYVPYNNPKLTAIAIKKVLNNSDNLGEKARERIKKLFSLEKRKNELLKTVKEVIENGK
ncbi:MAG: glycosyltransferase [Candidatus Aenigmarchaeota archaeon]|nr:glycosyltransferase [Candidatus Aenigmarchaeota archaeon]